MSAYYECRYCGSALDPGERCTCGMDGQIRKGTPIKWSRLTERAHKMQSVKLWAEKRMECEKGLQMVEASDSTVLFGALADLIVNSAEALGMTASEALSILATLVILPEMQKVHTQREGEQCPIDKLARMTEGEKSL